MRHAARAGGRALIVAGRRQGRLTGCLLALTLQASALTGACARPVPAPDVKFEWTITPQSPIAGDDLLLTMRLRDARAAPIAGATLAVQAHMSHPGMAPVLARAEERADGEYQVRLRLTMPGDWLLLVSGTLRDGASVSQRIDLPGVRPRDDRQPDA